MTESNRQLRQPTGISLVDGNPALRRARQILLLSDGYDVRSYATCAALLADPTSRGFARIIIDISEHRRDGRGEDGVEALDAMRASGWRGKAILLDGHEPSQALIDLASRHGDRLIDRMTGDGRLLAAVAETGAIRAR